MASTIQPQITTPGPDVERDAEKTQDEGSHSAQSDNSDREDVGEKSGAQEDVYNWDTDPHNPYNWSSGQRAMQVFAIASIAFLASMGTSIMSAAPTQLKAEFGVTTTQAILPLSLYVFALGLGPIVGGPLSETIGRLPIYIGGLIMGTFFTLGAGFTNSFAALNVLRFLAGFCFAPTLAIATGSLNEMYKPVERGIPSTFFILTPFLGPGIGPVIGSFVTHRKGWRWTQWTMIFFCIFSLILIIGFGRETFHTVIQQRRAKALNHAVPPPPPRKERINQFLTVTILARFTCSSPSPLSA